MAELQKRIGQRIRLLRTAKRHRGRALTIQDLAEKARLSIDYVNKLELGRYMPSAETLLAIATALDVPVGMLIVDPSRKMAAKERALEELTAFCAQFDATEVRYLLRVLEAIMERR